MQFPQVPLFVAFIGGLVSFLSPCVLPMLPAYVGYLTGTSLQELEQSPTTGYRKLALGRALGFVLGFTLIFMILGASASIVGKFLGAYRSYLRLLGGMLILLFGLHLTGLLPLKWLYYEKRAEFPSGIKSFGSALLMGSAFAAGWTPCVGPILSAILLYAGAAGTVQRGIMLLGVYSLGLAIPFVFTALAINHFLILLRRFGRYIPYITLFSGAILIGMGILILANKLQILNQYFYFLGGFEQNLIRQ